MASQSLGSVQALSWEETAEKIRQWQKQGETVVFTNGCFDILHRGHVLYLQQAAMLGQHLVVGLNSDASVRRLKGETRPLVHEEDRAVLLSALGCVDEVSCLRKIRRQSCSACCGRIS